MLDKSNCLWYTNKVVRWTAKAWSTTYIKKNLKKLEKSSWQIRQDVLTYQSSLRTKSSQTNASVPCKLNNVKTNYNTLDKFMDLFKSSCIRTNKTANENSWVILLEANCSKLWFEALRCFRYNFLRVWSWLRTNAGGVPNTCKSNGVFLRRYLVANGWVTREKPAFQWGTTVGNDC